MIYPLVTDLADEGIPVALTCRVLGFSKQAYFKWRANPVSRRDWDDAHLLNAARDVQHEDRSSATGTSPTNSSAEASSPAATGSTGCAPNSVCGRCTPANAVCPASQAHQCTTT